MTPRPVPGPCLRQRPGRGGRQPRRPSASSTSPPH